MVFQKSKPIDFLEMTNGIGIILDKVSIYQGAVVQN